MSLRGDVEKMVHYIWSEEEEHYQGYLKDCEERDINPKEHIFEVLQRIRHNIQEVPL